MISSGMMYAVMLSDVGHLGDIPITDRNNIREISSFSFSVLKSVNENLFASNK
jgi:hypothetical protein